MNINLTAPTKWGEMTADQFRMVVKVSLLHLTESERLFVLLCQLTGIRRYADEGQFGKGSMEPKVRAAIRFCEGRPDRVAIIGSLEKAPEAVRGLSGTRIHY